jgi:hypothetical protein
VEELELLQYEKATIFVRKIAVTGTSNDQMQDSGKSSNTALPEYKDDPEYQVSGRFVLSNCIIHCSPLDNYLVGQEILWYETRRFITVLTKPVI